MYYLLRHAHSAPSAEVATQDWPLSSLGDEQSHRLAHVLSRSRINEVFCSPYRRCLDTVAPFINLENRSLTVCEDLRECKIFDGWVDDPDKLLESAWQQRDLERPNCESASQCQQRLVDCVECIRQERSLIVSHGTAIAFLLNRLDPSFDYRRWREMPFPALFRVNGTLWDELPTR